MEYTQARMGRLFVLKFGHQDVLIKNLEDFARQENLRTGLILLIGALHQGQMVTGPKAPKIPPQPNWVNFKSGWETLGVGTLFSNASGPQIHLHATLGKKKRVLTGCIRKKSEVFLVVEAIVMELIGLSAEKGLDPKTGLQLLHLMHPRRV
jgi:uncharacterized protein